MERRPNWTGPAPADITAWTLVQAGHLIGRRFHLALAEVGLTPTQFGVLIQLDLQPGMTNAEAARAVLVTPQSMSELMASLVTAGYVERDTAPGRGHPVTGRITSAGAAILSRCQQAIAHVEDSLGLGPQERAALNRSLHAILTGPEDGRQR